MNLQVPHDVGKFLNSSTMSSFSRSAQFNGVAARFWRRPMKKEVLVLLAPTRT
jgi:hypothetical protein